MGGETSEESASEESESKEEVSSLSEDSDPSESKESDASEALESETGKSDGLTTDRASAKSEKEGEFSAKAKGKKNVHGVRAALNKAAERGDVDNLIKALKVYAQKKGITITVTETDGSVSVDIVTAADGSSVEEDTK